MTLEITEDERALLLEGLRLIQKDRIGRLTERYFTPREIATAMFELADLRDKLGVEK